MNQRKESVSNSIGELGSSESNQSKLKDNKVFILLAGSIITLLSSFFLTSRYPALGEKASFAGGSKLVELFTESPLIEQLPDATLLIKIATSTINWLEANFIGMVFGVTLASLLLALLSFIKVGSFKNRYLNALSGMFTGAPLGLCINCAAPVATGLSKGGINPVSVLAMMFSSATLNVIVFSMTIALFPTYLVLLKYSFTLLFIIIIIPHLARSFVVIEPIADAVKIQNTCEILEVYNISWIVACRHSFRLFFRNLAYIAIRVVPFMFVAAILGACLVHLFSFEKIVSFDATIKSVLFLSMISLVIPMPIGVDIIAAETFFSNGADIAHVAVILFSSGIFSIYSFWILKNCFGLKSVLKISAVLIGLTLVAGASGKFLNEYLLVSNSIAYYQDNYKRSNTNSGMSQTARTQKLLGKIGVPDQQMHYANNEFSIRKLNFNPPAKENNLHFVKKIGHDMGLREHAIRIRDTWTPSNVGQSIASGDFNNDYLPDLLIPERDGLGIYKNNGGVFTRTANDFPELGKFRIFSASFADLNNDGWQDIFLSSYLKGNFYILNNGKGEFSESPIAAPSSLPALTLNMSFIDLDQNGMLDIFYNNMTLAFLAFQNKLSPEYSSNGLYLNHDLNFTKTSLGGYVGESYSSIFSDINNDGEIDLWVGNDFHAPDIIYSGSAGELEKLNSSNQLLSESPFYSMSLDTADINNDLMLDTFATGLGHGRLKLSENEMAVYDSSELCDDFGIPENRQQCQSSLESRHSIPSLNPYLTDLRKCSRFRQHETNFQECLALGISNISKIDKNVEICNLITDDFPLVKANCFRHHDYLANHFEVPGFADDIPQTRNVNVVHMGHENHTQLNVSEDSVLRETDWTWNAKFADLDNDGWQDIYVANGYWWQQTLNHPNYLFINQKDGSFKIDATKSGLTDITPSPMYVYIDYDFDGDLDIITRSSLGQIRFYQNQESIHNRLIIQLQDMRGNFNGIGSKVIIKLADGSQQMREIRLGGGFMSFDAPQAHFGMGDQNQIESLKVIWPDGKTIWYESPLEAGYLYVFKRHPR